MPGQTNDSLDTGAVLTPVQRRLLKGVSDIPPDSDHERTTITRIRERVRASLVDYYLIMRELPPEEIRRAMALREGGNDRVHVENGEASLVGVVFLSSLPVLDSSEEVLEAGLRRFGKRAEKGIRMMVNRLGRTVESVDVTVAIELGDEFDAVAGADEEAFVDYSVSELLQAHHADAISEEQFMAAMAAKGLTKDPGGEEAP